MSKEITYDSVISPFEMENGAFSQVNLVFLSCLINIPPGVKGKVAAAIFQNIILNVYREKEEAGQKKGSRWSPAMGIEQIIAMIESSPKDEKHFMSMKNNYSSYITELLDNNIFYRLGKRNRYCYFYEKNVLSWGYLWNGPSYVYPASIKKVLASVKDLWDFYTHDGDKEARDSLSMDEFYDLLADMLRDMVSKLHPLAKSKLKQFDKGRSGAMLYVKELSSKIKDLPDLCGLDSLEKFQVARLPMSVQDDFSDLIPPESKEGSAGYKPSFNRTSKGALKRIRDMVFINYVKVRDIPEDELQVEKNAYHLMHFLEKNIKSVKHVQDDEITIYKNLGAEKENCERIYDALRSCGQLTSMFIRSWIEWYVRDNFDFHFGKGGLITSELLKTVKKYAHSYSSCCESVLSSIIYDDLDKIHRNSFCLQDLCVKYGMFVSYNFLLVKTGRKSTDIEFDNLLDSINSQSVGEKRSTLFSIMSSTMNYGNQAFKIDIKGLVYKKFLQLLRENNCTNEEHELSFKPISEDIRAYWRRIEHEYDKRTKVPNS
jgi:hypothetical protein